MNSRWGIGTTETPWEAQRAFSCLFKIHAARRFVLIWHGGHLSKLCHGGNLDEKELQDLSWWILKMYIKLWYDNAHTRELTVGLTNEIQYFWKTEYKHTANKILKKKKKQTNRWTFYFRITTLNIINYTYKTNTNKSIYDTCYCNSLMIFLVVSKRRNTEYVYENKKITFCFMKKQSVLSIINYIDQISKNIKIEK